MTLVLDTHVWLWWIGGPGCPELSATVREAIDQARAIRVSAMSCVEVAWLVAHGRLRLDRDPLLWQEQALSQPRVALVPITPAIAVTAANLEWSHKDPADRIIVATAVHHGGVLATKDQTIRSFRGVSTLW